MEQLKHLDLFTLVDLLVKHTDEYMKMFKEGATEYEFTQCKKMIQNLTDEIELRKQKTPVVKKIKTTKEGN